MRCLRLSLAVAVAASLVAAADAQFQPAASQPTPLAVVLLSGIDDPVVVAELKLKDEQVKALVARRTELWNETYTTAPNKLAETAGARTEATDALLKKTLTAEQYKRATQLGAQSILRAPAFGFGKVDPDTAPTFRLTRVTSATLKRYPELAGAFKLTDEQKKQLDQPVPKGLGGGGPGGRAIVPSKEQADAVKEFMGPVAKVWQTKFDPRLDARPEQPDYFSLLEARAVRADLKLTDADAKAVLELAEKWQKLESDRFSDLSPKEADEQAAALKPETEKALAALKPEQLARLKQISFQMSLRRFGPGPVTTGSHIEDVHTNAAVAKELALTEKQIEEFKALRDAFEKDAAPVLAAADAYDPAQKKLGDMAAARRTKAEAILTADQHAKLKALVGEPFVGSTTSDRFSGGRGTPVNVEARRAATFGTYSTELNLLALNKSIQDELKLTEEQIKTAAEKYRDVLAVRLPAPFGDDAEGYAKAMAERSKVTEEALGKLLSEEQTKRFRQIMLQSRERRPEGGFASPFIVNSAVAYPGVAKDVKLEDEQKKKLIAGTAPDEVLTAAQKSAIKELLGAEFKGDFVIRKAGFGTPFPQPSATVRVLAVVNKPAEEALKLTEEQTKKLAAARAAYQKAIQDAQPVGGFGGNINDYTAALRTAYEAFDKAVTDTLTDEQKPRLAQFAVQIAAAQNLVTALTAPETAKKLELTKEQTDKLIAIGAEALRLQDLRMTHVRMDPDLKLGLQMRDAADDRVMAVLTDTQKKTWKEMTGEPLPGLTKTVPNSFGRGGNFGPGGPGGLGGGGFGGPGGFGPGGGGGFGPFGP